MAYVREEATDLGRYFTVVVSRENEADDFVLYGIFEIVAIGNVDPAGERIPLYQKTGGAVYELTSDYLQAVYACWGRVDRTGEHGISVTGQPDTYFQFTNAATAANFAGIMAEVFSLSDDVLRRSGPQE